MVVVIAIEEVVRAWAPVAGGIKWVGKRVAERLAQSNNRFKAIALYDMNVIDNVEPEKQLRRSR